MRFATPLALILLLLFPYIIWLGRPEKGTARWRDWASLILRLLIILLLILGLAGAQLVSASDELAIVFLVDASDSINREQAQQAESFIQQAMEGLGPNDKAAMVVFGANALVERPMSALADLAPITSIPERLHTDIGEAIRLGLALFPAGSARRLVLLSDGVTTQGNVLEAVRLATAGDISIDVIPLPRDSLAVEAFLIEVDAPSRVGEGETFNINVSAESTENMPAELQVLAADLVVYDQTVQLRPGINSFAIPLRAGSPEFARYVVQLTPLKDSIYQNNQLAAFTDIIGAPSVLLVANEDQLDDRGNHLPDESIQLQLALEATGLNVERTTPTALPSNLEDLTSYDSVVLVNVNAKELSQRKMNALQHYVRDLAGGLVVVGGPESYGMGGYFLTPLEVILPVEMQIKDQERFPSVSIAIVIDRSGSMAIQEGGVTKIQLAAEGAVRVVELLNDLDEIAVIPVDTEPDQPIGPAPATNRSEIIARIRKIGAGGGGIFVRTGLEAAAKALAESSNDVKHIILLADGADSEQKEGVPELIEALSAEGISLSTVSIGEGPDVRWLQEMAELGGGRFHFTDRAANLPQIFTQETTSIQRSYLVEERFFPSLGDSPFARQHAIFQAMANSGITRVPPLMGYVGTSPKDTAQIILSTHLGDPLLAAWEHGLGRSVAWTSDSSSRWATDWVQWPGFASFWSNVVRWSIRDERQGQIDANVILSDGEARIVVDARNDSGGYLNELTIEATVVSPDGESDNISFQQIGPGLYEGRFIPHDEGAYFLRITGTTREGEAIAGQTIGWVLGYSPEYGTLKTNPQLLSQIAEISGGRTFDVTAVEEAGAVFERYRPGTKTSQPIWPWLVGLAIILLPLDIAVRRLAITNRDARRAWEVTFGRLRWKSRPVSGRSEQVARLFQAKSRAASSRDIEGDSIKGSSVIDVSTQDMSDTGTMGELKGLETPAKPEGPDVPQDDQSLASHLLRKKRQRQTGTGKEDET